MSFDTSPVEIHQTFEKPHSKIRTNLKTRSNIIKNAHNHTRPTMCKPRAGKSLTVSAHKTLSQSHFLLKPKKELCRECGMSYLKDDLTDNKIHRNFHERYLNGRTWSSTWGETVVEISHDERIVKVNPTKPSETKAVLQLLEIANKDLNAPDDNEFWLSSEDKGLVYVYVKQNLAIGVISVERVRNGKWLSLEDGKVISNSKVEILAGISRIYVSKNNRRSGVGIKLLKCIQTEFIYGLIIPNHSIGWSQPSFSGGKLASVFNGVKHKSGKTLVPIYVP